MSERYSRLFSLSENLYAVGSPVVIAAGTLLKDNQTGKIVAQLKMRSISPKTIIGAKVRLCLFDNAGKAIGDPVDFDYLDLSAARDAEFGQKTPVPVPESKARSYKAAVQEVVFADKTTWTASNAAWEPLPTQKTLDTVLVNAELIKQYKIAVGSNFSYYPLGEKDLWYCACGALNHEDESCHTCHRTLFELQTIDLEQLAKDKDTRLAQEAAAAEAKAAAEKAAAEAAKKKTAKILKITTPAVCAVAIITLLLNFVIIPNSKYNRAVSLMEAEQYKEAIAAFEAIDGYKDSEEQIKNCQDAIDAADQAKIEAEMAEKYARAEELLAAGDYDGAVAIFDGLGDYSDAAERTLEVRYQQAEAYLAEDKKYEAATTFYKISTYKDSWDRCFAIWGEITQRETIASGSENAVALNTDGSVIAAGSNKLGACNVSSWHDIVAISAGDYNTIGLKSDGTVISTTVTNSMYDAGQCDVSSWKDIVAISVGNMQTIGLKADGTVVAAGTNYYNQSAVSDWKDIVAISAGWAHTVGLKSDGTVVATGSNENNQCAVKNWTDIVAISAGQFHTVGLKKDGTVVSTKYSSKYYHGQGDVSAWKDIVSISAGNAHTIGLKSDGTLIATGQMLWKQCEVSNWKNVESISAGSRHTMGLKSDGSVYITPYGEIDVSSWKNIKLPN